MGKKVTEVIDTNVILRFFVGDNIPQQQQAIKWFKEAEQGKRKIIIKPLIVAESCFVLETSYLKKRDKIADVFEVFLSQKWLLVEDRKTMFSVWSYYRDNIHFVDSYLLAWIRNNNADLLSFDKKLLNKI